MSLVTDWGECVAPNRCRTGGVLVSVLPTRARKIYLGIVKLGQIVGSKTKTQKSVRSAGVESIILESGFCRTEVVRVLSEFLVAVFAIL